MKRILSSLSVIVVVAALVVGGTAAYFNDTEVSTGNVFTTGSIDLKVDHSVATYNGESCELNCTPVTQELIVNGGFENPTLSNGGYAIYPNGISGWAIESGGGVEIQRNAAGAPHSGLQHAELDSTNSSSMSQTITTVAGVKYRLSFWYSPRPNRPANDNAIDYKVIIVSNNNTLVSGKVGVNESVGAQTVWKQYIYDFVAESAQTKIYFGDAGISNTYGGYLDDISVKELVCIASVYENTPGGYCELWEEKDLATEKFFNFEDLKPQDSGSNLISLHVEDNEAYVCLNLVNKLDEEKGRNDAEADAGDESDDMGELSGYLNLVGWYSDAMGNKISKIFGPENTDAMGAISYADSVTGTPVLPGETKYVLLEWCFGDMTVNGTTVTCNGNADDINQAQTDMFLADLQFNAVQTRNNSSFTCTSLIEQ
ncbi:MAG: hypothetical protein US83_C0014G0002 [Candidatus Falkowbacteria bacterium GW2011_GWC2_38_22]|uniref:DUF642 domain-containing protein n=1 Tax=Candidatus Falkowbacteria bacterium GW2011_GWE1_38_31 TaxID=1618638 RepID=A0A0G0JSL6_9BACT|nr:MAG: hypothetical protein US73_C0011G0002 [Candidatus Falkowbacteria bacterium GW2011_GWF2_38_1205]KKQ60660.1 MAG: hypothetical protein US83_C0014G0002 [Candidatus Falkowbacteria bacterium GW2011_GWC2_38_22]KKQ62800.1 MAG: hypothetical protein US84_C0011G0002 [Candidatus Falkowbacteria bacterium GW2011_GWF1_38_22]KKQ64912.1 MAG: hypothetical protein US87_C0011G0002 [Candidatus Falkowbacteria bacterium GW2011_GWE2_38_254]KKQ69632.1 MAG: hypothetical protein US91_C0011G0002 [Candidatus Falkowb